jgi:hypothetical protein
MLPVASKNTSSQMHNPSNFFIILVALLLNNLLPLAAGFLAHLAA